MFTAKEVTDKITLLSEEIAREAPLNDIQAKRIAIKMVLNHYETEKFWLRTFQDKYKELLDRVKYKDAVIDKLRMDYKRKSKRLRDIERYIYYLENTTYMHHP